MTRMGIVLGEAVQFGEGVVDGGDFPLLEAEVGEGDDAILIDDEEAGALAQGDEGALDVVLAEDFAVGVREAGEGDVVTLEVVAGVFQGVGGDGHDLGVAALEVRDPVSQLREMPAAEGSLEAAEEDEDDGLAAEGGEGELGAVDGGEGEVRGRGADGDGVALDGHGGSDYGMGEGGSQRGRVGLCYHRAAFRKRRAICGSSSFRAKAGAA